MVSAQYYGLTNINNALFQKKRRNEREGGRGRAAENRQFEAMSDASLKVMWGVLRYIVADEGIISARPHAMHPTYISIMLGT